MQTVQQTVKTQLVQVSDKVGDLPSVVQRHAVMAQTAKGTAEIPMSQFVDKVVNIPVVVQQQIPKAPMILVDTTQ